MFQTDFDKFTKASILNSNEELRHLNPEFHLYTRKNALALLEKYDTVFVKPNYGARGFGIVRLKKDGKIIEATNEAGTTKRVYDSELPDWSQEKHIVQQGIDIPRLKNGGVFDIRVHMQKIEDWGIVGIVTKVSEKEKFLTNIPHGGKSFQTGDVLGELFDLETVEGIIDSMVKASGEIAKTLENEYAGIHELGIDFAVDKESKLWIIEVNTNPPASLFKALGDVEITDIITTNKQKLRGIKTQNFSFNHLGKKGCLSC